MQCKLSIQQADMKITSIYALYIRVPKYTKQTLAEPKRELAMH